MSMSLLVLVCLGVLSLSKDFEMINVAVECFPHGVHIVIFDPKLLTRLSHDGSDERVVGLDDTWEEVVSGLVVESSSEHIPEPAVCSIVLCCGHLHLSPGDKCKGSPTYPLLP